MFHMFIHICIYVFFLLSVSSPNSYTHGPQPVSLPYNLIKRDHRQDDGYGSPAKLPYRERK